MIDPDDYLRGYIKGFETQMIKSGFLPAVAKHWLLANEINEELRGWEDNIDKGYMYEDEPDEQLPDAPKKLETGVPQDDQVNRREARLLNHQKVDLRLQRLAEEVGQTLPDELREELKRTGQLQRVAQNIVKAKQKQHGPSQPHKGLLGHQRH